MSGVTEVVVIAPGAPETPVAVVSPGAAEVSVIVTGVAATPVAITAGPVTQMATVVMGGAPATPVLVNVMSPPAMIANGAVASDALPLMDGIVAAGVTPAWTRGDHVHPSDTSRLALTGGTMTGMLNLASDPTVNAQAATKHYVDMTTAASAFPEAPLDGITYGRQMATWNQVIAAHNDIVDGGNF